MHPSKGVHKNMLKAWYFTKLNSKLNATATLRNNIGNHLDSLSKNNPYIHQHMIIILLLMISI